MQPIVLKVTAFIREVKLIFVYSIVIFYFLVCSIELYSQQLQHSNSIRVYSKTAEVKQPVTDAPRQIGTIDLKIDTTDIFSKVQQALVDLDLITRNSVKAITEKVDNSQKKLEETEFTKNTLKALGKAKALNERQKADLDKYEALVNTQKDSIEILKTLRASLTDNLQGKTIEAATQLALKKQYRKPFCL